MPGGRPRKYFTEEGRREARLDSKRKSYQRFVFLTVLHNVNLFLLFYGNVRKERAKRRQRAKRSARRAKKEKRTQDRQTQETEGEGNLQDRTSGIQPEEKSQLTDAVSPAVGLLYITKRVEIDQCIIQMFQKIEIGEFQSDADLTCYLTRLHYEVLGLIGLSNWPTVRPQIIARRQKLRPLREYAVLLEREANRRQNLRDGSKQPWNLVSRAIQKLEKIENSLEEIRLYIDHIGLDGYLQDFREHKLMWQ
jgi:hypothetical protein